MDIGSEVTKIRSLFLDRARQPHNSVATFNGVR